MSLRATFPLSALIEQIQAELPPMMEQAHVPSLGLALIRDGQIAWQAAFGVKQANTSEVLTTQTIFQAASLSKPLFAYGVLCLVDQGVLNLDRPLIEYLPATFVSDDPPLKQITARIVLCHLTGWPNWREDGQPLVRSTAPGAQFSYSGEGFGYLQEVIEHITDQSLEQFMQQTVLVPLGMPRSTYAWTTPEADIASGHDARGKPSTPFRTPGFHAAASLQTTPFEYARFICAMLAPETIPHPLSVACRQKLLRPQVELEPAIAWGLGWGLQQTEDGWAFWHSGDNPGFKNLALAYPQARVGLVIMTNGDGGTELWEPLLNISLGGKYPLFAWRAKSH